MSSVSSALTSLASVSTMDFVKGSSGARSEGFYLRFSKYSTIGWAVLLVGVAYLSRHVRFVFEAAFSLRGLTSGALLGGVLLAVFQRQGRPAPVILGMLAAFLVMAGVEVLPKWSATSLLWQRWIGQEIFWPWYTLVGLAVCLGVAWAARVMLGREPPEAR